MKNKTLKKYKIDIFHLENKQYVYEFEGDDSFFEALKEEIEQELIEKGSFHAKVTLVKNETMIQLQYEIKGALQVLCDRSLEIFDYPIAINPKIILKFGDHDEELSEELYLIDRNSQQINIAQHLFEFISLEIPMKKLHPRFLENTEDEEVEIIDNHEGIIVYSTITKDEKEQANSDQEKPIDPRWAALANLK